MSILPNVKQRKINKKYFAKQLRSNEQLSTFESTLKQTQTRKVMKTTKTYSSQSAAKRALKRIFGVGVFGGNFTLLFLQLTLLKVHLKKLFKVGVDNI